jgi:hypothetical protein
MSERMTDRRVMWCALVDAANYAETVIDAYAHCMDDPQVVIQRERIAAYNRVAKKYFGTTISEAVNEPFKGAKLMPLWQLMGWRSASDSRPAEAITPQTPARGGIVADDVEGER